MNPDWDNEFLDLLEHDPQKLVNLRHHDYMERGGAGSVEMIMWLHRRCVPRSARRCAAFTRHYYAPMLTGYGLCRLRRRRRLIFRIEEHHGHSYR